MSLELSSWIARRQRAIEIAILAFFIAYLLHELMLSKLFAPSVAPDRFRDLGILWDLADYVVQHHRYQIGSYFFPPSNAILFHIYGLMNRELAFRIYLLLQAASFVLVLWMWSGFLGIAKRPDRSLIILSALLAAHFYVHFEFHMQNANLITLFLVSFAVIFQRSQASGFCYALSLAMKPYGSVLILPWMIWRGYYRWAAHAVLWLCIFYALLTGLWFGLADAIGVHRDWIVSLALGASEDGAALFSIKAGLAALFGSDISDVRVGWANWIAQGIWIVALIIFFIPTLLRRVPRSTRAMASESAAILLAPLPLGALQQPARGAVLLVAMLVVSTAAFADDRPAWSRAVLFGVLAFVAVSTHAVPIGPLHFLLTLPVCMASMLGLAMARRSRDRRAAGCDVAEAMTFHATS